MAQPAPIRVAIATDLHYLQGSDGEISPQVCSGGSQVDPMAALITMLQSPNPELVSSSADLLLCPGDITTRACVKSFKKGWGDLNNLKDTLGASHLIAATGNHEISSRAKEDHSVPGNAESAIEPFEHLIITEDYPAKFARPESKWIYWGRGYEVVTGDSWVVVTINSCHYHNSLLPNEYERGRIGSAALFELENKLAQLSKDFIYRIVILHHPPIAHEETDVQLGRTAMYNGDLLVKVVQRTCEDWVIVHGHKHLFRLTQSEGGEYAPIILGAASFGAMITGDLASKTKNQFYILELSINSDDGRLRGRFESVCWDGNEWSQCSKIAHGLPHGCGFDLENPVKSKKLAKDIKALIASSGQPFVTWAELEQKLDSLRYLMPQEIETLGKKLDDIGVQRMPKDGVWFPQELWLEIP